MISDAGTITSLVKINYPSPSRPLLNRYFALRHGESQANEQKIIISDPKNGISGYGLTSNGAEQVRASIQETYDTGILDSATVIYSSEFARAQETAQIARSILGSGAVILTPKLRERFFGRWEKMPDAHYENVWKADERDFLHKNEGVESRAEVLERILSLIIELEELYTGRKLLLISHGDPIQVLQSYFVGSPLASSRQMPPLGIGKIRELILF